MDFTKFVELLEDSTLFFPRLSLLTDPLEGFLTKPTVARFKHIPEDATEEERREHEERATHNLRAMRMGRDLLFVSSWHLNEHESAAMWGLYLKSDEGIALQSTIGRMKRAFEPAAEDVYIGRVNYVDYNEEEIPWNNAMYLAVHKRRSFEHEREVRAITFGVDERPGKLVPVDLRTLIERVFVAPSSPRWIYHLVEKLVKRYGLATPVVHSALDERPLY